MMVRAGTQVPSVESPLLCILIGTSVLWKLEPGTEPVYPVHVHDSLYNTDTVFDAGQFKYVCSPTGQNQGNTVHGIVKMQKA